MSSAHVLIPVRNEAAMIGQVVRGCLKLNPTLTVWVIDDGSTDESGLKAEREGAHVLTNTGPHRGKTASFRLALNQLPPEVEWIFVMDGDGQHSPEDLPRLWNLRADADLIVGNRLPDAAAMPWIRRATNLAMSSFLRAWFRTEVRDTQCGLRLIRRSWLGDWLPQGHRFEFETELSLLVTRRPSRVKNLDIRAIYGQERSKIRPWHDAINFARILTIKR